MGRNHESPRHQLPAAERHAAWLDDYISGMSLQKVADKHGVTKQAVHQVVHRQLDEARNRRNDLGDLYLEIQIARYTDLYQRCIDELNSTDDGREVGKAQLISAARGALDSLTKILGLDHGITVNVHTETALDRELAAMTKQLGEVLDGTVEPVAELEAAPDDRHD